MIITGHNLLSDKTTYIRNCMSSSLPMVQLWLWTYDKQSWSSTEIHRKPPSSEKAHTTEWVGSWTCLIERVRDGVTISYQLPLLCTICGQEFSYPLPRKHNS